MEYQEGIKKTQRWIECINCKCIYEIEDKDRLFDVTEIKCERCGGTITIISFRFNHN